LAIHRALLEQLEAQARRSVMPGAEAHRRLNDDQPIGLDSGAGRFSRANRRDQRIPGRCDEDAADADCAQSGLTARRPVLVQHVDGPGLSGATPPADGGEAEVTVGGSVEEDPEAARPFLDGHRPAAIEGCQQFPWRLIVE
jgi:hypothetical protein